MTGAKRKDPVIKKHPSSTFTRASVRSKSPIVDDAELLQLSEESRALLHLIENKFETKINELISILDAKDEKIEHLERENATLKRDLNGVLERVDNLEVDGRQCDIILSGDSVPVGAVGENTSGVASTVLKTMLKYNLRPDSICSAYRLGKPPSIERPDRRNILLRLSSEKEKDDIIGSGRSVKPTGLYINENLTPLRAGILYSLRKLKKKHPERIEHCGSIRGRCYVWLKFNGDRARNRKVFINSNAALQNFIVNELKLNFDEVLSDIQM